MPQKDYFHDIICSALIKDGWTITDDPLTIEFEDTEYFIDLGAERLIAAEKGSEKIAVEIKSFLRESLATELHLVSGQISNYRLALADAGIERKLYLAVTNPAYQKIISKRFAQRIIEYNQISMIVVDSVKEEIAQWL